MKTFVVTGGTSGIGKALAFTYLDRGDQVIVIGPDPKKGSDFVDAAHKMGADERAFFIRADLSLISENRRVISEVKERFTVVDVLVLCARYFRSYRTVTEEGFEHNFALYYLSRFLLGYGLVELMEKANHPVIMNVAGPAVTPGNIHWDDLQLEHSYNGWKAMFQGGKLVDLLGVSFAAEHRGYRTRYVLLFPGGTQTGLAGEFDPATAIEISEMKKSGQPVEVSIVPIIAIIDAPPAEPLSAFVEGQRVSLAQPSFDPDAAARLDTLTRELVNSKSIGG